MLTLATILDNPGEQPHDTRYRDPRELRALGYSDLIIYRTTGLSGLLGPDTPSSADIQRWLGDQYERVQRAVSDAADAGLGVWLTYDAPALAHELVGSAMTCGEREAPMLNPASEELLEMCGACLDALLARIEPVEGIVLRLGDSDAAKVRYLTGHDLYAPRPEAAGGLGYADRMVKWIHYFHELVVRKLGRKLIVRAWNVKPGGMHDDPDLCRDVVERLPVDERLILSFKFTQTDFWRYQRWNPSSLACGDRPIIYELQCQREFEGKGAVPNYQPPLWRDGMSEVDEGEGVMGLAEAAERVNLAGLWAWVRGGGWRGPYIGPKTESWIDANVFAVPRLAADPKADPDELAQAWIDERFGADAALAEPMLRILRHSERTALETFYVGPYARRRRTPWFPSSNFIQDDQIDAEAAWAMVQRLPEAVLDAVVAQKHAAEQRIAGDRRALREAAARADRPPPEEISASLDYAQTLAQTLRALLAGLVAYRRWLRRSTAAHAQAAEQAMRYCQSCWVHHTQLPATRGGASPFGSDNLWDLTQRVIDHLHQPAGVARLSGQRSPRPPR